MAPLLRGRSSKHFRGKRWRVGPRGGNENKFKLENKKRGYAISSINNLVVKVATLILAGKLMQKCHADEVPVLVVALAAQCVEGV